MKRSVEKVEYLKRLLVGRPLKSAENDEQKLSRTAALALLSSDALSSIAYGTEQIVVVLVALSAAAIWYSLPIAAFVIILLISLTLSYRQIIHAYPHGGGAYVVSSENLGKNAGLIAGGSLLIDYMLTVAVSVSAGAEAITSAVPALFGHQVAISVVIVLLIMMMNLRGLRESASFLMIPVYTFIAVITVLIVVGLYNIVTGAQPLNATALPGAVVPGVSVALILRAFSSGSSSLTGVEAISNAVPFFKNHGRKCSCDLDDHGCDLRVLLRRYHFYQLLVRYRTRSRSDRPISNRLCCFWSWVYVLRFAICHSADFSSCRKYWIFRLPRVGV